MEDLAGGPMLRPPGIAPGGGAGNTEPSEWAPPAPGLGLALSCQPPCGQRSPREVTVSASPDSTLQDTLSKNSSSLSFEILDKCTPTPRWSALGTASECLWSAAVLAIVRVPPLTCWPLCGLGGLTLPPRATERSPPRRLPG